MRITADTVLTRVYGAKPLDWAGGHDLRKMNDRGVAYLTAPKVEGDILGLSRSSSVEGMIQ
jgi:hypothetical protein